MITHTPPPAPYPQPQLNALTTSTEELSQAVQQPLSLQLGPTPPSAARNTISTSDHYMDNILGSCGPDGNAVTDYGITAWDMAQVYLSPDANHRGFDIDVDLKYAKYLTHPSWGLKFCHINGRLVLEHIKKGTIGSKIPQWRSTLIGAWLRRIGAHDIDSLKDIHQAVAQIDHSGDKSCVLTFSHPKIQHGLTNDGIPQINIDQLNPKNLLHHVCPD